MMRAPIRRHSVGWATLGLGILALGLIFLGGPAAAGPLQFDPAPDQGQPITAVGYRGQVGAQFELACPADALLGAVWGNHPYTDDSSICAAAIHAGVLTRAGGHVLIEIRPGQPSYAGNHRNGVTSRSYGSWSGGFVFPQAALNLPGQPKPPPDPYATDWSTTAVDLGGAPEQRFEFVCPPGGHPASIWGSGTYTDDSSICTAAVHAGAIGLSSGGRVAIEVRPGQDRYPASRRNGVQSGAWGRWERSFVVRAE